MTRKSADMKQGQSEAGRVKCRVKFEVLARGKEEGVRFVACFLCSEPSRC